MKLGEPDDSGRRRPIPIEGTEHTLDVDVVVSAIGQGPNPLLTSATPELELTKWGNIVADEENGKTNMKGIFAGGDIVTGAATVILAMGAGKKAARAMDEYLRTGKW
jgi:glutamate synthase (NADPH/NADH) small chain